MKIICGPDNVKEFNKMLKAAVPEFHALARLMYAEGMIDGLRGATIEFHDTAPALVEVKKVEIKHCEGCKQWQRDTVGGGEGLGTCLINSRPRVMKWPKQTACDKFFEVIV